MASLVRLLRLARRADRLHAGRAPRASRTALPGLFSFSSSSAPSAEFAPLASHDEDDENDGSDAASGDPDALERGAAGDGGRGAAGSSGEVDEEEGGRLSLRAKVALACNLVVVCLVIGLLAGLPILLALVVLVAVVVVTERRGGGGGGEDEDAVAVGALRVREMQRMPPGVLGARHAGHGRRMLRAHMLDPVNARLSMVDRDFTAEDYEALLALDSQPSTDGAAQQQIDRLPSHTVTQAMLDSAARAGEKAKTCSICLENFAVDAHVRTLPCLHQFHTGCIDTWLLDKALCPVCKMECFA